MTLTRLRLAAVMCALVAGGCATQSPRSQPPATTEPALPPANFDDLRPILDPQLASLGLRLTRGALVSTVTRRPSPTGRHLALYVEPTEGWTPARYTDSIVPVTRLLAIGLFDRWSGLESFDVCEEPPPGVDDRPEPQPLSTIELTQKAATTLEWDRVDLEGLLAASLERGGGVRFVASETLKAEPAYQAARTAAEARSSPGD